MIKFKTLSFYTKFKKQLWFILLTWTIAILLSLAWNIYHHYQSIQETALYTARTAFEKDLLYRRWAAEHGGVYVPVTDHTQPNPYLEFIPNRDFEALDKEFTKINPAYMTRQAFELQTEDSYIRGHITSKNPINPINAPSALEIEALNNFTEGKQEYYGLHEVDGEVVYFYMQSLAVEESCLPCHAAQGYQVGEVRGGISIILSSEDFRKTFEPQLVRVVWAHVVAYMLGVVGLWFAYSYLRLDIDAHLDHEKKLFRMGYFDALTGLYSRSFFDQYKKDNKGRNSIPITIIYFDVDGLKFVNDTFGHEAGDRLLQRAAEVIRSTFRDEDIKVRLSGDEFVVLMVNSFVSDAVIQSRFLQLIEQDNLVDEKRPILKISFGMANVVGFQNLESGLQAADAAMYEMKKSKSESK